MTQQKLSHGYYLFIVKKNPRSFWLRMVLAEIEEDKSGEKTRPNIITYH